MRTRPFFLVLALCALVACEGKKRKSKASDDSERSTEKTSRTSETAKTSAAPPGSMAQPPPKGDLPPSTAADLEKLCDGGNAKSCNDLGSAWAEGKNGVSGKDFAKAKALYEKACTLKDGMGCFNLGNAYRLGEGVAVDNKQAAARFTQACDMDQAKACTELGIMYYEGTSVPKDKALAVTLLEKACRLGSEVACKNLTLIKK